MEFQIINGDASLEQVLQCSREIAHWNQSGRAIGSTSICVFSYLARLYLSVGRTLMEHTKIQLSFYLRDYKQCVFAI